MKKRAFTLAEALIAMMLAATISTILFLTVKPNNFNEEALKKAGSNMMYQIDFAVKRMILKSSVNNSLEELYDVSGTRFKIVDGGAQAKFEALMKKNLVGIRKTVSATYRAMDIKSNAGNSGLKISNFSTGFVLKNKTYVAIKLNGNCSTTETQIYSPASRNTRQRVDSCGLLFFDVNGEAMPNILNYDQYIISIGKINIK